MNLLSSLLRAPDAVPAAPPRAARSGLVSVWLLVGGLALTAGGVLSAVSALRAETQARFDAQVDRFRMGLDRRVSTAEQILVETRAAFQLAEDMTGQEFVDYMRLRGLDPYFPGVRSYGIIEATGDPSTPPRLRVTHYFEAGAARAPSWQLDSDAPRQQALQQAMRTGLLTLSGPVRPAGADGTGWMLLIPIIGQDPVARLFFVDLDIGDVLGGLARATGAGLHLRLFDGPGDQPGQLLFDSRPGGRVEQGQPRSRFSMEQPLMVVDRRLTLKVTSTPELHLAPGLALPWVIGVAGALLSALLALAAYLLMSARDRAGRMAAEMTADLQRMARAVERTSSAVYGLDLDGRVTWANAGFERLTGLDADECIGRLAVDLPEVAGADAHSRRILAAAIAQRESRRLELRNQMREGVRFWTDTELQPTRDSDGQINGFICIASDITRRKLAELRLRESEHLMRVIADNLPARVSYWDHERRCRFVNRRFCDAFGRTPEELQGQELSADIFGAVHYERLLPLVERVLQGQAQYDEVATRDASGRFSAWQLHYIPDVDEGQVRGFFELALDVTELRRARDLALQASQAKSRFLSSMSHEIRTPLNAVLGMLALLRTTPMDSRQSEYADKANRAARSLLTLLNDILDLAKIEAGKMSLAPRPFSVDELLRDLSVIYAGSVGTKELELLFEVDPLLPPRWVADDLRLRQVLINLGGNAIKFTEKGEVVLSLRLVERCDDLVRVEVAVRDTGIGIAPQERERIFNEFDQANESTAREFGGSGLGLGICKKLLGLMGSELRLDSEPGQGSRFWFELVLPVAAAEAPPVTWGERRVLIVDDNPEARESLGVMAASLGWRCDLAADAHEALEHIAHAGLEEPYDAVFIDWRMPDLDGWQASQRIRRLPAAARAPLIIMVTANGREMLDQRPPEEQALLDGFLVKPVTASMLRDALAPPGPPAAAPPPPGAPERPLAGLRLLLVEDNPTNQQVASELLARQGAWVTVASDGREGLALIRDQAEAFDAVLMDVLMPEMDGHAATRAVREQLGNWRLPIIAMTANAMESDRLECLAAGMNDHVGKPFDIHELVDTLLRHVRPSAGVAAPVAAADGVAVGADDRVSVLDRLGAVGRLGGDDALYARLVPSFAESLAGIAARLPTLLHSVPQAEATRLLHTLKGSAATMGADQLAAAAARAEKLLSQDLTRSGDADEALRAVAEAIEQALAALGTVRATQPG
ncbi:response regulator [Ramlibacter sp. AW1]|uniref:Virulence sensor protein BvgS n=1 Tax=Ramlibacter aurantiacus TaxID=2801330 RepID=A0A936ZVG7_9BURK|nr:response regulator [Ramlibacter aurantiacus]MBL0421319.1 response regulator [Ramlibacter aurantiacus]